MSNHISTGISENRICSAHRYFLPTEKRTLQRLVLHKLCNGRVVSG
jgi:hypothetical protein